MRKGEGNDLPGIGRIGENLLIAGHRGVEADLAHGIAGGAEAEPFEYGAVGKDKERRRPGLDPGVMIGCALGRCALARCILVRSGPAVAAKVAAKSGLGSLPQWLPV